MRRRFLHSFFTCLSFRLKLVNLRALLVSALLVLPPLAYADSFAALTVTPRGEQSFDIATGVTTLPQGGEIVDAARGIRVTSDFIRYQDGVYLETAAAQAEGRFGTLQADRLYLDLASNELRAQGSLQLESEGMSLRADELLFDLNDEVVRLSGWVKSSAPAFESAALIMELDSSRALLVAPYRYENGALTLSQGKAGVLLQLTREALPEGGFRYTPSTTVHAEVLASLSPYLAH